MIQIHFRGCFWGVGRSDGFCFGSPLVYIFLFGFCWVLFGVHICFKTQFYLFIFLSVAVCGRWSFLRGIEWTTHQGIGGGWLLGSGSSCNSYAHWNHHPRDSHSECSWYDLCTFLTISLVHSCWKPRFRVKEIVTPGQEKLHLQIWKTPEMVAAMSQTKIPFCFESQ